MGFDIFGIRPKNTKGDYIRFTIWSWGPLWTYCERVAPEICVQVKHARTNDGEQVSAENAEALAEVLEKELASGRASEYVARERDNSEEIETAMIMRKVFGIKSQDSNILDVKDIEDFAVFLKNCGGFSIW